MPQPSRDPVRVLGAAFLPTTSKRGPLGAVALAALLASTACSRSDPPNTGAAAERLAAASASASATPTGAPADAGIAWQHAADDAQVDAAFAAARAVGKPVFVYWGAKWCPPCNQVKATLFNRQDFIERSRAFVPVYIDGDSPGAQKLGARFHVSGYPTMVLFNPQGAEVTRLPGEVDPERYTQVLTLGMNAARPVREVLAQALGEPPAAGGERARGVADTRAREVASDRHRNVATAADRPAALTPNDWRLLAFYAWDLDEQQLVPKGRIASTLARLADACPPTEDEAATRLRLKAVFAAQTETPLAASPRAATPPAPTALRPEARADLLRTLADPPAARRVFDVLTYTAADIARAGGAPGSAGRAELRDALDAALKRFGADPTLSRADRIDALIAQVDLATLDRAPSTGTASMPSSSPAGATPPALPEPLLADIREQTARADREITDGYERQAVITGCAYLLERAGLGAESDTLLKANLAKSHSPYYLMSELASNAKARGDRAEALHWYGEAWAKSEGPATRLQWGASYLNALVELAPADEARIEQTATQVFDEAAGLPDAFDGRSGRSLQRVGTKLAGWNRGGAHAAVLGRLQGRLDGVCGGLPAGDARRAACQALLKPAAGKNWA